MQCLPAMHNISDIVVEISNWEANAMPTSHAQHPACMSALINVTISMRVLLPDWTGQTLL